MRSVSRLFSSAAAPANQPPLPRALAASLASVSSRRLNSDASSVSTEYGVARSQHAPSQAHTNANHSDSAWEEDDGDEDDIRRPSGLSRPASLRSLPSPAAHDASCSRWRRTNLPMMLLQR
jgi:hypothetical protein